MVWARVDWFDSDGTNERVGEERLAELRAAAGDAEGAAAFVGASAIEGAGEEGEERSEGGALEDRGIAAGRELLGPEASVGVRCDVGRHVRVDVGHAHRDPGHESALGIGDGARERGVDLLGPERRPRPEREGEQQGDAPDRPATEASDAHHLSSI